MKKTLYQIHKWLALIFSAPLIVLAVTGLVMTLTSPEKPALRPGLQRERPLVSLLATFKEAHPNQQILRVIYNPQTVTLFVRGEEMRLITLDRADGKILKDIAPSDDLYILSKMIHENLLLKKPGKITVAVSGVALLMILLSGFIFWIRNNFLEQLKNLFQTKNLKSNKGLHLIIGITMLLPLGFSSITGSLIEFHGVFFQDKNPIEHIRPEACQLEEQLAVMSKLPLGDKGAFFLCRPDFPYLNWTSKDGTRQFTPLGQEVLFVPKEDWSASAGSRKHFFVHWHGGENFERLKTPYQLSTSLSLLTLTMTGLILWIKKRAKRKSL